MGDDNFIVDIVFLVVGFFDGRWRLNHFGFSGFGGNFGLFPHPHLLPLVEDFDGDVAEEADGEDEEHDVELHSGAEVRRVGVSNDETCAFPEAVITEGSFLVPSEKCTVET